MKLNAGKTSRFLKNPDPSFRAVLFYGADQGLIHERAQHLAKSIVEDLGDPFRISELNGAQIKLDPTRLIDEALAQSLIGGERIVRIQLGGEDISKPLLQYLNEEAQNSLLIIEAGELTTRSPVRKLIEKSVNAAAIACYSDGVTEISSLIDSVMNKNNMTLNLDAKTYLINNLGSDRMVSRSELEKLVTYAGNQTKISMNDIVAIIGDNGALSVDEIIYAAADGNRAALEKNLARAFMEGTPAITVLRTAIRHYQKLHLASGCIRKGQSLGQATKSIKPPIIFLFIDRFKRQLHHWSGDKIERALSILTEAEVNCKSTALPAEAICGRALMSLSQAARQ